MLLTRRANARAEGERGAFAPTAARPLQAWKGEDVRRFGDAVLKTAGLLLLASVLLFDIHCGSDSKRLVGTWSASSGCGNITVTFRKDGTGMMSFMGTEEFKWRLEDGTIVISEPDGSDEETYEYEFNEDGDLVITEEEYGPIVFHRVK